MIVGILTPCMILLYLIIIVVAYHVFCHKEDGDQHHVQDNHHPNPVIEVRIGFLSLMSACFLYAYHSRQFLPRNWKQMPLLLQDTPS